MYGSCYLQIAGAERSSDPFFCLHIRIRYPPLDRVPSWALRMTLGPWCNLWVGLYGGYDSISLLDWFSSISAFSSATDHTHTHTHTHTSSSVYNPFLRPLNPLLHTSNTLVCSPDQRNSVFLFKGMRKCLQSQFRNWEWLRKDKLWNFASLPISAELVSTFSCRYYSQLGVEMSMRHLFPEFHVLEKAKALRRLVFPWRRSHTTPLRPSQTLERGEGSSRPGSLTLSFFGLPPFLLSTISWTS